MCEKELWCTKWLVINPSFNLASCEGILHPFPLRHRYMRSVLARQRDRSLRLTDVKSGGPKYKAYPDHQLDFFLASPSATTVE